MVRWRPSSCNTVCNASLLVLEDNIPAHEATNHMTTNTKTSAEARPRHGVTWAWSREEARRRHEASTTDPVLEPAQTFDDQYFTFFELAAIRPDADAARTGAHSQTIPRTSLRCLRRLANPAHQRRAPQRHAGRTEDRAVQYRPVRKRRKPYFPGAIGPRRIAETPPHGRTPQRSGAPNRHGPRSRRLWATASLPHITLDFRFDSQSLAACITD